MEDHFSMDWGGGGVVVWGGGFRMIQAQEGLCSYENLMLPLM